MGTAGGYRKRRRNRRRILVVALAACLAPIAFAQDPQFPLAPEEEAPPEPKRYAVELIVFEYAGSAAASDEVFLPEPLPDDPLAFGPEGNALDEAGAALEFSDQTGGIDAAADAETAAIEAADPNAPLTEFLGYDTVHLSVLNRSELTMTPMYERLQRLDAYKTLLHSGWIQAAVEEELSPAVRVRSLGPVPISMDGTFTLYLGRYLHLVVDLALEDGQTGARAPAAQRDSLDDSWSGFGYDERFDDRTGPVVFRLQEDRIVADGDLRYFDHPKFGVLAKITRIEETESGGLSGRLRSN